MGRRIAADIAEGARTLARLLAPPAARWANRLGDWLAAVSWGKFFLVSLLLLVLSAILGGLLLDGRPTVVVARTGSSEPPTVRIELRGAPTAAPTPPAVGRTDPPTVVVDESGVRIAVDQDGRRQTLMIDRRGVRLLPDETAALGRPDDAVLTLPDEAVTDAARLRQALETARATIQDIVDEQWARRAADGIEVHRHEDGNGLASFALLVVVSGVIVKIVLGSKQKAELRARAAAAAAADEGLKRQLAEARLKMMQAQVEPHFLLTRSPPWTT
ncbi:MAG: hypothetical protein NZL99_06710 [Burkholderiaceae bacterium]|nr:hypothetical protein [Burkholderiaceae bacterium]